MKAATAITATDGNQVTHHVEEATSSITKQELSPPPTPPISLQTRNEILDEITQQFAVTTPKMRGIVTQFVSEMQKGLYNEGETGIHKRSTQCHMY